MDDIIIYSKSFEHQLRNVEHILILFKEANLPLKTAKCMIADNKVNYLDFLFTSKGMTISREKLENVLAIPPPSTSKILYRFLCGFHKYYRRMIPNWRRIIERLFKMCESKKNFKWNEETFQWYANLKEKRVTTPLS